MLANNEAMATIAVRDLGVAREFYGRKLGLRVASENEEAITYESGSSKIVVYRSQFAGSNKATSATWMIAEDLRKLVESLKTKGIAFEHYDMPMLKLEGDVHVADGMSVAWLKDPRWKYPEPVSAHLT